MDSLPGTPQIQNIIPTTYFKTDSLRRADPRRDRRAVHPDRRHAYLEWRRRRAAAAGEGYGEGHINEPAALSMSSLRHRASPFCR